MTWETIGSTGAAGDAPFLRAGYPAVLFTEEGKPIGDVRTSASGRMLIGATRAGPGFVPAGSACPVGAPAFAIVRDHPRGALQPERRPGRGPPRTRLMGANGDLSCGRCGAWNLRHCSDCGREIGAAVAPVPLPGLRRTRGVGIIPDEDLDAFETWLASRDCTAGTVKDVRSYVRRADALGAATPDQVHGATRVPGTEFPRFAQSTRGGMRRAPELYEDFREAVRA